MKCRTCGRDKPDDAARRGWRRGLCGRCYALEQGYGPSTDRVRKYRQDPEKRERDRERSRAWKAANRDRVLAYAREPTCKTPGNQIGPASAATDRDRGNQEASS